MGDSPLRSRYHFSNITDHNLKIHKLTLQLELLAIKIEEQNDGGGTKAKSLMRCCTTFKQKKQDQSTQHLTNNNKKILMSNVLFAPLY